ncbi:protein SIX6OS1 isoform X5 [Etheostoma spectabile]|uniref:protein SIX6OS1 isoform X5 n=1 Tax=Etheostoma spectabile TaxID=54343 RepID=UPI0013AF0625|nr:protein SIX6OS1-like isoform X5 [Etheostoma spectabile]
MNDQHSLNVNTIDSLLFQFALQTRELSQKKNEINQQIKVCRADTAERRSYIETIHRDIKKLEEEIRVKQNTVIHNKANARREVYEERIASYRKTFQLHKEYYHQNTLAQKLLTLQAEKEEIEYRIKTCDEQITMKQKELYHLAGPAVNSSSNEELPDSVSGQQPKAESEKPQTEEENNFSIDISSLHLNQSKILQNRHRTSTGANTEEIHEENKVQHTTAFSPSPEIESSELWSCHPLDEQTQPDEMHTEEQETGQEDQVLQPTVSVMEEAEEDEVGEKVVIDKEQAPSEEDNEEVTAFPLSSSQETNPQSSPAGMTAVPSTPSFPFNFSHASSPHQGTSHPKSPAFLFSLNSDPSTPGFSGFGFDVCSPQDEESSFNFTSSFFNEKKTTESKSATCPEFLFGQPEQIEDFQFAFTPKSPQATNKDTTREEFPFSFNF